MDAKKEENDASNPSNSRKRVLSESEKDKDDDDNDLITMKEFLEMNEYIAFTANSVLGKQRDDTCTYDEGYRRQAVYSCTDCLVDGQLAGICLACSIHCHAQHNILELYTKRRFRCDCGNSKFKTSCRLKPNKNKVNKRNTYNQNFNGLYCVCSRPYPSDDFQSAMQQCCICEDWFHLEHVYDSWEEIDENGTSEMVCPGCLARHKFISLYADDKYEEPKSEEIVPCIKTWLINLSTYERPKDGQALFFDNHEWRTRLCKCEDCLTKYKKRGVDFLTDLSDSLDVYEAREDENVTNGTDIEWFDNKSTYVQKVIDTLGRDVAVNSFWDYNDMRDAIMDYLKEVKGQNRVVNVDDVKKIFEDLRKEKQKRRRFEE